MDWLINATVWVQAPIVAFVLLCLALVLGWGLQKLVFALIPRDDEEQHILGSADLCRMLRNPSESGGGVVKLEALGETPDQTQSPGGKSSSAALHPASPPEKNRLHSDSNHSHNNTKEP